MKAIDSALFHRVIPPRIPAMSLHPGLILLHGRGADEEDLLGLTPHLDGRLLLLSVRAPHPFPYGGGYTWFDFDEVGTPEPAMFKAGLEKLSAFVNDVLLRYPVDRKHLYLLGFSMGTIMSYALALTQPGCIRGVVANSGYIPERTHLTYRWEEITPVEFFVAHGTYDNIIPVQLARRTKELLNAAHAAFDYKEYPMAHEISEESITDLSRWLTQRLNAGSKESS